LAHPTRFERATFAFGALLLPPSPVQRLNYRCFTLIHALIVANADPCNCFSL
jgi:hypothetical protein